MPILDRSSRDFSHYSFDSTLLFIPLFCKEGQGEVESEDVGPHPMSVQTGHSFPRRR